MRTIDACEVFREGDIITVRITGNGFLYNMVRIIAGTLICVGNGSLEPARMPEILAARDRNARVPRHPRMGLR